MRARVGGPPPSHSVQYRDTQMKKIQMTVLRRSRSRWLSVGYASLVVERDSSPCPMSFVLRYVIIPLLSCRCPSLPALTPFFMSLCFVFLYVTKSGTMSTLSREIRIPTQDPWICLPRVARSERDRGREGETQRSRYYIMYLSLSLSRNSLDHSPL